MGLGRQASPLGAAPHLGRPSRWTRWKTVSCNSWSVIPKFLDRKRRSACSHSESFSFCGSGILRKIKLLRRDRASKSIIRNSALVALSAITVIWVLIWSTALLVLWIWWVNDSTTSIFLARGWLTSAPLAYQLGVWKLCLSVCVMYVKHISPPSILHRLQPDLDKHDLGRGR